jgi:transcriptional regulator with XRE-family HTH domain
MNTIKEFMHEKRLTQAELAEKLGYTQPHIANIINGKAEINDKFRWRWLEAFGPSALRVLNGDDKQEPA